MTNKDKGSICIPLAIYPVVISVVIAIALRRESQMLSAVSSYYHTPSLNSSWLQFLIIPLIIYTIRCIILIFPLFSEGQKWIRITKYGLYSCFLAEIFVIFMIKSIFTEQVSSGFNLISGKEILYAAIGLSCVLQMIGMIVGLVVSHLKNKHI